jgi:hypothetical protein
MKQNSQKILLLGYGSASVPFSMYREAVKTILPNISDAGVVSLLQYLRKKQYLYLDAYTGLVSLTQQGIKVVEGLFPAFNQKSGLVVLFFLKPPKHDPQFRTLRRILIAKHVKQITRGVYAAQGQLHAEVSLTLERLYSGHIIAVTVKDWLFGDEKSILASVFDEKAFYRTYSGISRDINGLIDILKDKKTLTEQNKEKIHSVFSLFFNTLQTDTRLKQDSANNDLNPQEILKSFQNMLFYRPN